MKGERHFFISGRLLVWQLRDQSLDLGEKEARGKRKQQAQGKNY